MRYGFFFLICTLQLLASACSSKEKKEPTAPRSGYNIIILADLSDRLLAKEQMHRDSALLHTIFETYVKLARQRYFIHSKDRLQILAAPQKTLPAATEEIERQLRFDMGAVPIKEKAKWLTAKQNFFDSLAGNLYYMAAAGRQSSDYAGSDIWKFFDQYLDAYLVKDNHTLNKIVVLTDGYFDFESLKDKKKAGCRYSYSSELMQQARTKGTNWARVFDTCGLIPVRLPKNTEILVAELSPKNSHPQEEDIIAALWKKWLSESGVKSFQLLEKTSLPECLKTVADFLWQ
jgi:hypothetical protein